ncbi:MAG: hypothetical protein K6T83_03770 [Alicyclobacillus sp.]|nr:hypothetical protein [Alicyclobacillus sp.]
MQKKTEFGIEITDEDFEDILVGAFEGGSNYWVTDVKFDEDKPKGAPSAVWAAKQLLNGKTVRILEDGEDEYKTLTRDKMFSGISRFIERRSQERRLLTYTSTTPQGEIKRLDWGMYDAEDCDVILQYALLGDIVYG